MKNKKAVLLVVAMTVAISLTVLTGCASDQGAWARMGIDTEDISAITLVSGSGVLKPLSGDALSQFVAEFDKLEVEVTEDGYPDNDFEYAVRIYLDGEDGFCEYRLGGQLVFKDGFDKAKRGYCYLSDEQYASIKAQIVALFYAK